MGKGRDAEGLFACCAMCGAAGLCCLVVVLVIGLIGLGIAKIVIGVMYLHDCDLERMIPIFLIVSAVNPMSFGRLGKNDDDSSGGGIICGIIGLLFSLAWLIAGSVWVYGTWAKVHANTYIPCPKVNATLMNATAGCTPGTCNDMLLKFSFAMVTIDWTLYGLIIVLIGGMIVRACAKVKRQQYEKF